MEKTLAIAFLIIFLLFFIFILRGLYLKALLHFRLLKKIYPDELKNVNTYFQFMWITNTFRLNFDILFWFWMPIYYSKFSPDEFSESALELHFKLKQNNKKLIILSICFIVCFITFWIIASKLGG